MTTKSDAYQITSYRDFDHPVLYHLSGNIYDLRCETDRNARFNQMVRRFEFDAHTPQCAGNERIATSCVTFDYLSRLPDIQRILVRAQRSDRLTNEESFHWMLEITTVLGDNRRIVRFIFQRAKLAFLAPLLSAQITILATASLLPNGDKNAHILKYNLRAMSHSMMYWSAEVLLLARDLGLFKWMAKQSRQRFSDDLKASMMDILIFGHYLESKFKIANPLFNRRIFDIRREKLEHEGKILTFKQYIKLRNQCFKEMENMCGWPPCRFMQEDNGVVHERMHICKGCHLIKYCCRNHQKKHWKFIHSQQCREY